MGSVSLAQPLSPATADGACSRLLVELWGQDLAMKLLDRLVSRGRGKQTVDSDDQEVWILDQVFPCVFSGVLEEVILEDRGSSVEVWTHVAAVCLELNQADLSCVVLSICGTEQNQSLVPRPGEGAAHGTRVPVTTDKVLMKISLTFSCPLRSSDFGCLINKNHVNLKLL